LYSIEPQIDSLEEFDTPDPSVFNDGGDNSGPDSLGDTVLNTSSNIKEILSDSDEEKEELEIVFGTLVSRNSSQPGNQRTSWQNR
jgi:hypothetical protein